MDRAKIAVSTVEPMNERSNKGKAETSISALSDASERREYSNIEPPLRVIGRRTSDIAVRATEPQSFGVMTAQAGQFRSSMTGQPDKQPGK
ncbi:hypothetical protein ACR9YC_09470 [Parasphingorhabdus sp. DH2-15]|uniref:hypothetical protein n=1 Tax=Parasphingorhabdus sp. DH2-15 TaxID=3444112 RepID=UPI003F685D67